MICLFILRALVHYSIWCCNRVGNSKGLVRDAGGAMALGHTDSLGVRQTGCLWGSWT